MTTFQQVSFIFLSVVILSSAASVVLFKNLIYSALSMIGSFLGVAGIFILLHAELVAAAQVLIYVGAISILVIFAIMLTHHNARGDNRLFFHRQAWVALPIAAVAGITLMAIMATATYNATSEPQNTPADQIASLLFNEYAFPFELVSLALLVAMVGAVLLAQREKN